MPFAWSLNPYMGCVHRCTFCYVRGFEARAERPSDDRYGTSIRVKLNIAEVLRRELARPSWRHEEVVVGAATDPYQPVEGRYRLTRACLEELARSHTPFSIITRGPLIWRDADVLRDASVRVPVGVSFSIPTLDERVWRATEPGTSPPRSRLEVVRRLSEAGIDVGVALAPLLPGISDGAEQLAAVVRAARDAGARTIWAAVLNLRPGTKEHFLRGARAGVAGAAPALRGALRGPGVSPCRRQQAGARGGPTARSRACRAAASEAPSGASAGAARARRHARSVESARVADTPEITVLLADDHEVVREGLRLSLLRSPHIRIVGEAPDGQTAVSLAERRRPDVVIMDLRMPEMDGIEATEEIMRLNPEAHVLIFTAYSERALLTRGLESGARGYVLKEAAHEVLLKAIERVAAGDTFVDPALIPSLTTGKDGRDILTQREREILQLLADGMSNADVATQLFISQETVKSHVRHILAKLEAETRTQAVAIALREAMID